MNSDDSSGNKDIKVQILESELKIIMEKEVEMRDLYDEIINRCENNYICRKIIAIRDDEIKHIGYVEIMLSLLGIKGEGQ